MTAYTLSFQNNSSNSATACVYTTAPDIGVPNVMSLAWLTKPSHPTTRLNFDWNIDYSLVWSENGTLKPGATFEASQTWAVDPHGENAVLLAYDEHGYTFSNKSSAAPAGSLIVKQSSSVPLRKASVGVGISGQPALAVEAQPNILLAFTPHPKYWITFGSYEVGEVLDLEEISDSFEIDYPANVYSAVVTLDINNQWSVDYK
ncbi:hypothetical protein WAE56_14245 [Iodobacter sp. LRB]|uniref:protein rhiA n=1 Tax=unclassified Iodobacter TaxID=235634 RepID=UPI000C107B88|nr:protein rhiA [Iodobacter sp. BJB302]PHV00748.1 protein rhiA [Iodobacter sp. BJB302]